MKILANLKHNMPIFSPVEGGVRRGYLYNKANNAITKNRRPSAAGLIIGAGELISLCYMILKLLVIFMTRDGTRSRMHIS